jgi:hypothetical protein
MKYQDCAEAVQADEDGGFPAGLADANINPLTGLATDYLNHFNEAIMLLEMLSSCPDCIDDFLGWRPMSYREHFAASHFKGRDMAIAAYDAADPALRGRFDTLSDIMTTVLEATRAALGSGMPPQAAGPLAERAAASLRPLVARAGALINGDESASQPAAPQSIVDGLMKR